MLGIDDEWWLLYFLVTLLILDGYAICAYLKSIKAELSKLTKAPMNYELKMALDDIMARIDETNLELNVLKDELSSKSSHPPSNWDDQ